MDRRRILLLGFAVLAVLSIADIYVNGVGIFEHFGQGFTFRMGPEPPHVSRNMEVRRPAAGIDRLSLQGQGGLVTVRGAAVDEVIVVATVKAFATDEERAAALADAVSLGLTVADGAAVPRLVEAERRSGERLAVSWDITLPYDRMVDVTNGLGTVRISDMAGDVSVVAVGNIELANLSGKVTVSSQGSNVKLVDAAGDVDLDVAYGAVELQNVGGNLTVNASSGEVQIQGVQGDLYLQGSMGHVKVTDLAGDLYGRYNLGFVEAYDTAGAVELELAAGSTIIRPRSAGPINVSVRTGDLNLSIPRHLASSYSFEIAAQPDELNVDSRLTALMEADGEAGQRQPARLEVRQGKLNVLLVD